MMHLMGNQIPSSIRRWNSLANSRTNSSLVWERTKKITEYIGNIFEESELNEKRFVGISDRPLSMVLLREKHKLKK